MHVRTYFLISIVIAQGFVSEKAYSGNGYYYGFDALYHVLNTDTQTIQTPPPGIPPGSSSDSYFDIGLHLGYKYKRHRNRQFYMAPEFYLNTQDGDDLIYSTNLKLGWEDEQISWYTSLGLSRISKYDRNEAVIGFGIEYNISHRLSVGFELLHYDPIDEISVVELPPLTIETRTKRSLNAVKLGVTYYLHE